MLAASLLWFTLDGCFKMLVAVAVAGGILTVLTLILRFFRRSGPDEKIAIFRRGISIPYRIAVAAGFAATVLWAR
ncbi:MAG: hypothetical protein LH465_00115 [Sphingomonas bacterium]|nr:hypothetical protein [Sphingomonas bacterium]